MPTHQKSSIRPIAALVVLLGLLRPAVGMQPVERISCYPSKILLNGPTARHQVLVTAHASDYLRDATRRAVYRSSDPESVKVSASGVVTPMGNGRGQIFVQLQQHRAIVDVEVIHAEESLQPSYENDIRPILTAAGCNSGACHGKQRGQNGFQLSLLGFDADFDYRAIAQQARGRRIFPSAPEQSLLLLKATASIPHGGGQRLKPNGDPYAALEQWIGSGVPRTAPGSPKFEGIRLEPSKCRMQAEADQQLLVTAHYDDGSARDVTALTTFQSSQTAVANVDESGLVHAGSLSGETAIMARFMDQIAVCNILIPLDIDVPEERYTVLPRENFIDDLVWQKLKSLRIIPSEPAADEKLLRRAYVDTIGRIPTPVEARQYLDDSRSDKWPRLIDHLLERSEYSDFWANKWVDLLRPNPYRVGIKAVFNYDAWIRQAFRENMPYDRFVHELITAQGSTFHNGAVTLFRDRRSPDEITTLVSQLFLGIRLECAKCHHHPFERWGQDDFYHFAAYFGRLARKGSGLSPPISGSEEMVYSAETGDVRHPQDGKIMQPRPLFGEPQGIEEDTDPREALSNWITGDDPFFVQVMANRIWADLMGTGLVEPVDDLRDTNPPSNGPLLTALGEDFSRHDHDIKHLIRRIMNSHVYRLSSQPNEHNVGDTRNFSRHYRQRFRAEVLLDAICDITGVPEKFTAMPPDSRSTSIWTTRVNSVFLDSFGRPDRNQDPPCERTSESTMVQTLHLMNSPNLHAKVTSDQGCAARLAESDRPPNEIVDELYLAVYARRPSAEEVLVAQESFAESDRRQATEDLMWALLNTPEFLFKD